MREITKPLSIFVPNNGTGDDGALEQMANCLQVDAGVAGALSADHHLGYSMPIGGTVAYKDAISPSGVGYDIGCGNMAVKTDLLWQDVLNVFDRQIWLSSVMDDVARRVSFGIGRANGEQLKTKAGVTILDELYEDETIDDNLYQKAHTQLGTVGSGNHYVDLFRGDDGYIWVGVHFGSRGLGHTIASSYIGKDEGLFDAPSLLATDTDEGQTYIHQMELAGRYAYAGREEVVATVLDILGNPEVLHTVHNHHNFAWQEDHFGESGLWVVRKGATPLFPGQQGFVGGSMGEDAVIIEGHDWMQDAADAGAAALWSAPHGAGRAMSRNEAKGKMRHVCGSCGHVQEKGEGWQLVGNTKIAACPKCPHGTSARKQLAGGKINWDEVREGLRLQGIELRGGEADEAPGAYKRLPDVLAAHDSYVEVVNTLTPIGVAMAGPGTSDPYKD